MIYLARPDLGSEEELEPRSGTALSTKGWTVRSLPGCKSTAQPDISRDADASLLDPLREVWVLGSVADPSFQRSPEHQYTALGHYDPHFMVPDFLFHC